MSTEVRAALSPCSSIFRFYRILAKMPTDLKTRLSVAAHFSQQKVEYKQNVTIGHRLVRLWHSPFYASVDISLRCVTSDKVKYRTAT